MRLRVNGGFCCCAKEIERFIPLQSLTEVRTESAKGYCMTIKSIELKTNQQQPQSTLDQISLVGMEEVDQRQIAKIMREGIEASSQKLLI